MAFPAALPGGAGARDPFLVSGVVGFEPFSFGGHLPDEGLRVGRAGMVVPGLGVGGLGQGVGFGLRGEPQLSAHVWRGSGVGAFTLEDLGFESAAGHAADDVGLVGYLQSADRGGAELLKFRAGQVRAG